LDEVALRVLDHQPGRIPISELKQGPHLLRGQGGLESELGDEGTGHRDDDAVGVEGLVVGLGGDAACTPADHAYGTVEPHVELLRDSARQDVVATLDLAVRLPPRKI